MAKIKNFITGLKGATLDSEEKRFITANQPVGIILFKRNCVDREQIKQLISSVKELCMGYQPLILIDQEGGRVTRLPTPLFNKPPSMAELVTSAATKQEAYSKVYDNYLEIANILKDLGINVNCAPVADLYIKGAHSIIGDRSFGEDPEIVSYLSEAACKGLAAGGVQSVIKHIPGHGRSLHDSHFTLPRVDTELKLLEATDFKVFRELVSQKIAMTAHIIYESLDEARCATVSPDVISYIRKDIGFLGLIMTDDLSMKALHGAMKERAHDAIAAGCDLLLHCNGDMDEMQQVAEAAVQLTDEVSRKVMSLDCFM